MNIEISEAARKCAEEMMKLTADTIEFRKHTTPDSLRAEANQIVQLAINEAIAEKNKRIEGLEQERDQLRIDIREIRHQHEQEAKEWRGDEETEEFISKLKKRIAELELRGFQQLICVHHNDKERESYNTCPICLIHIHKQACKERDELRSQLAADTERLNKLERFLWSEKIGNGIAIFPSRDITGGHRFSFYDLGDEDGTHCGDEVTTWKHSLREAIDALPKP